MEAELECITASLKGVRGGAESKHGDLSPSQHLMAYALTALSAV